MRILLAVPTAYVCLLINCFGAGLKGELTCDNCAVDREYSVELRPIDARNPVERSHVMRDGNFSFFNVAQGSYLLTVVSQTGTVVRAESVNIDEHGPTVHLSLDVSRPIAMKRPSGIVSARHLQHEPPKPARKAYERSTRLLRDGDIEGSVEALRRAVAFDPHYMEAFNNLGCRLMTLNRPADAVTAFERAAAIDPSAPLVYANLAFAHIALRDFTTAEQVARRGVEIDASDMKARYAIAMSLYGQKKYSDEMLKLMQVSADVFPNANVLLASALAQRGDLTRATSVLEDYLSSKAPEKRAQAEALLTSLRR